MARRTIKTPIADQQATRPNLETPLLGHHTAQETFLDALAHQRMHHGWLLHGEKGIGKAKLAHHASAFLVAQNARQPTNGPLAVDPLHPDARLIAQGAHPDAFWLDRMSGSDGKKTPKTIAVAQVRAILHKLQSTAAYGGWRTLVVDSVDELNVEGANALLKPLEEPPHKTVIFLVAHSLSAVLPTIRSRCRHLALHSLNIDHMTQLADETWSDDTRDLAIALAEGRVGRMQQLALSDQCLPTFTAFCSLCATPQANRAEQLAVASTVNAMSEDDRNLFLMLVEEWMSRRLRSVSEPPGLETPSSSLSMSQKNTMAAFWSEQTKQLSIRRAINLDITERIMALFVQLDQVYSQAKHQFRVPQ